MLDVRPSIYCSWGIYENLSRFGDGKTNINLEYIEKYKNLWIFNFWVELEFRVNRMWWVIEVWSMTSGGNIILIIIDYYNFLFTQKNI